VIEPARPPVLEPESVRTTAVPPRPASPASPASQGPTSQGPTSQAPRPPHPSIGVREDAGVAPRDFSNALAKLQQQRQTGAPAPLPPTDPAQALAQLQRQREVGAPAPPPPASRPAGGVALEAQRTAADSPRRMPAATPAGINVAGALAAEASTRGAPGAMLGSPPPIQPIVPSTKSITSPLNLKPGTGPLSPSRAPAPIAIVGGSSLTIKSPDKAISPSRPPPATLLAAIDANAPKLPTRDAFVPPPAPMGIAPPIVAPVAPSSGKGLTMPVPPPAAPPSQPSTSPKAFAPPAGGPPASYERAFRQWSSPNITTADESGAANAGPVTFQVYTAQDISAGRAPMRSLPAVPREAKKPSVAARVGMAAVGVLVVMLTAAAVIAVSTDDPKPAAPRATVEPPAPSVDTVTEPVPTAIMIGDPVDDTVEELPPEPANTTTAAPATAASPKPKPKPTTPAPPASLKGMAPPPNPYGK